MKKILLSLLIWFSFPNVHAPRSVEFDKLQPYTSAEVQKLASANGDELLSDCAKYFDKIYVYLGMQILDVEVEIIDAFLKIPYLLDKATSSYGMVDSVMCRRLCLWYSKECNEFLIEIGKKENEEGKLASRIINEKDGDCIYKDRRVCWHKDYTGCLFICAKSYIIHSGLGTTSAMFFMNQNGLMKSSGYILLQVEGVTRLVIYGGSAGDYCMIPIPLNKYNPTQLMPFKYSQDNSRVNFDSSWFQNLRPEFLIENSENGTVYFLPFDKLDSRNNIWVNLAKLLQDFSNPSILVLFKLYAGIVNLFEQKDKFIVSENEATCCASVASLFASISILKSKQQSIFIDPNLFSSINSDHSKMPDKPFVFDYAAEDVSVDQAKVKKNISNDDDDDDQQDQLAQVTNNLKDNGRADYRAVVGVLRGLDKLATKHGLTREKIGGGGGSHETYRYFWKNDETILNSENFTLIRLHNGATLHVAQINKWTNDVICKINGLIDRTKNYKTSKQYLKAKKTK